MAAPIVAPGEYQRASKGPRTKTEKKKVFALKVREEEKGLRT